MNIKPKKRAELKSFFKKRDIPTEDNFSDLVDACINYADDGIQKKEGNPLSVEAVGDKLSQKRVLSFFNSFSDQQASWSLSLNPRTALDDVASARAGLNISDAQGKSRLFIDQKNDNVGLGTLEPKALLHLNSTDADNSTKNLLLAGNTSGPHLALRNQGLSALFSAENTPVPLHLQTEGGSTYIGGDVAIKGTIEQEAWQEVTTFVGHWSHQNITKKVEFYKDSLGIVHLHGNLLEQPFTGNQLEAARKIAIDKINTSSDSDAVKSLYRGYVNGIVVNQKGFAGHPMDMEIFTLPPGYRPDYSRIFIVMGDNKFSRLDISEDGVVKMERSWHPSRFASLDGISFRAAK